MKQHFHIRDKITHTHAPTYMIEHSMRSDIKNKTFNRYQFQNDKNWMFKETSHRHVLKHGDRTQIELYLAEVIHRYNYINVKKNNSQSLRTLEHWLICRKWKKKKEFIYKWWTTVVSQSKRSEFFFEAKKNNNNVWTHYIFFVLLYNRRVDDELATQAYGLFTYTVARQTPTIHTSWRTHLLFHKEISSEKFCNEWNVIGDKYTILSSQEHRHFYPSSSNVAKKQSVIP